ncbi:MAG: ferritin-like domain-containing protein, partial [Myxococcota bacterium]|nr:ferritin-like domain-containing protein [Myxococcota bacterium]
RNFCLGETFAVPLFHAMYAGTTHPMAKKALERVLRDEAVHRAFGWDALDALLERDIPQIRSYIEKVLPRYIEQFRSAYASGEQSNPLSESERAMGLINLSDYKEIWTKTYETDVKKRFVKRGIQVP